MIYEENNNAYVRGVIIKRPTFSHELFGEQFFELEILCPRLSNQEDIVPITLSNRLMDEFSFELGKEVTFVGQFRSYNKQIDGKSKLILTLFAKDVCENDYKKNPNIITLFGYVCKKPIYRTTPFDREIADLLIAVNRSYSKSDYIPAIAWGRNARFCKHLEVGDKIAVFGRIQSRKYIKKVDEKSTEERIAFELSLSRIGTHENVDKLFKEQENFFKDLNALPKINLKNTIITQEL